MSQITKTSLALALALLAFLGVLALAGCGDKNSQSNFDPDSGTHPAGWLPSDHMTAALSHLDTCAPCHGADFAGGIAKVACTQCHLGDQTHIHPLAWDNLVYALHGNFVDQNGTTACANTFCHGTSLDGVGGTGPSCTSCHLGGPLSPHPAGWNTQADFTSGTLPLHAQFVGNNGTVSCRNVVCHGANLQGVYLSGPSCNTCHNF